MWGIYLGKGPEKEVKLSFVQYRSIRTNTLAGCKLVFIHKKREFSTKGLPLHPTLLCFPPRIKRLICHTNPVSYPRFPPSNSTKKALLFQKAFLRRPNELGQAFPPNQNSKTDFTSKTNPKCSSPPQYVTKQKRTFHQ